MSFPNLAIGALGLVATRRRDGFREATVIAVTVFGFGTSIVHLMDILATGNLAPGNTLQNVANLIRPALLIGFLVALRRAEASPQAEAGTAGFERWRKPLLQASAPVTMAIATAYGVGFAMGQPFLVTLAGVLVAAAILALVLIRAPWRGKQQDQGASGAA